MATQTYDNLWKQAMGDLSEQLHVEGVEEEEPGAEASQQREVTIFQAFQHFACLYIKYLQIFRKLEGCYDCMVHPQKRLAVKNILELVIRRVLELKSALVKWNPPNSSVKIPVGQEEPFPWEYVNLDDILVDLKMSPEMLEVPIPKYFREDISSIINQRDRIVHGYMNLKHKTDQIFIPDNFQSDITSECMPLEKAIYIIQRNERGRQAVEKTALLQKEREQDRQGRLYEASAKMEMDAEIAATNLQRMIKGYNSRHEANAERDNELMFIGMRPRKDNVEVLEKELSVTYIKRKQEQRENKEAYEKALDDMRVLIAEEEGPEKKEELREERTIWITDQVAQEKFPEDLEEFYKLKTFVPEQNDEEGGGKADKKADKKEKDKKDKGKKDKKSKKKNDEPEPLPQLQGRTELTDAMKNLTTGYEDVWDERDESSNFQQKHDVELTKAVVRPDVYEELRKNVDDMLVMNLKKIKMQIAPGGKKGKGKKGKGKKGKGKKGAKGKKKKPLPGEKISELKGLDADHMLSVLIENKIVVRCRDRSISSLIGEFNYLGSVHHNADRSNEGEWEPQDPSIAQLRQSITEYCILPNGSAAIKEKAQTQVKSIMFYGPSGSGKSHAVDAVANELGALLIHLTPEKLQGKFQGKTGPTKLVHMVFTVARDPTMQPCIIYIDESERFFTGGKKNKDKDGPSRFKKDLVTYKNQALDNTHRVVIIGATKNPENGDMKDYKSFWDKYLYFPFPDYPSRVLIWSHYIIKRVKEGILKKMEEQGAAAAVSSSPKTGGGLAKKKQADLDAQIRIVLERVSISSLAHISEGYTAGAIACTANTIITNRRVAQYRLRPLLSSDFVNTLAQQVLNYRDDKQTFMEFTRLITGLNDRRKKVENLVKGDSGDKKKGDKKKK